MPMMEKNPFDRADAPNRQTVQDWFENSEGIYSGQTGQFIKKSEDGCCPPEISVLQAGEIAEYKGGKK